MIIQYSARTHQGRIRNNNEDNFYVNFHIKSDTSQNEMVCNGEQGAMNFVAAVCDGMGGESKGELASLTAVSSIVPSSYERIRENIASTIQDANQKICEIIMENHGKRSGTTFAALYIDIDKAVACNVGDSSVFLLRKGEFEKISVDHSKGQMMINLGLMTPEEVRSWPGRHELTQYLGIFEDEMTIEPHVKEDIVLEENDIFLICSDGLTDMLEENIIQEILQSGKKPEYITEDLISEALKAGGKDNITVVVLKVAEKKGGLLSKIVKNITNFVSK